MSPGLLNLLLRVEAVERAHDPEFGPVFGELEVGCDHGGCGDSQKLLDKSPVNAVFEEVNGEAVPEPAECGALRDPGLVKRVNKSALDRSGGHVACMCPAREQVRRRIGSEFEILAEYAAGLAGEDGVPLVIALEGVHVYDVVGHVNVLALEDGCFADPETAGINEHKGKTILELVYVLEECCYFLAGEKPVERDPLGNDAGARERVCLVENLGVKIPDGALGLIEVGEGFALFHHLLEVATECFGIEASGFLAEMPDEPSKMGDVTVGRFWASSCFSELLFCAFDEIHIFHSFLVRYDWSITAGTLNNKRSPKECQFTPCDFPRMKSCCMNEAV